MSLSDDTTMEVRSGLRRRVDVEAASRLRLVEDVVYTVTFRRLHDGVPFVVTRVHLPEPVARLVVDAAELRDGAVSTSTVIALLEPHLDEPISEAAQSITVAPADDDVARRRRLPPGASDAARRPAVLRCVGHAGRVGGQPLPARAVHLPGDAAPLQLGCDFGAVFGVQPRMARRNHSVRASTRPQSSAVAGSMNTPESTR